MSVSLPLFLLVALSLSISPSIYSSFPLTLFLFLFLFVFLVVLLLPLLISFHLSVFLSFLHLISLTRPFSFLFPFLSRKTNEWICLYQGSKAFSTVTSMLIHNEKVYVTGVYIRHFIFNYYSFRLILPFFHFRFPSLTMYLFLSVGEIYCIVGWAAFESDWAGRTWGSPYAIAVMDIGGFILENQVPGSGSGIVLMYRFYILQFYDFPLILTFLLTFFSLPLIICSSSSNLLNFY